MTGVAVPVAVAVGVFVLVPVAVGVALGVDVPAGVNVTVGVGDAPGVDVPVGVTVTVEVLPGVVVAAGVPGTLGVTAGSVGEGVGNMVAPGVGVLCSGLDVAVVEGTFLRPLLPVASTRAVFLCAPVGLARQGFGGSVGVTPIGAIVGVGVTEGGAVAVINTALLTGL